MGCTLRSTFLFFHSVFIHYLLPFWAFTARCQLQRSGWWIGEAPEGNLCSLHPCTFRVQRTEPHDLLKKLDSPLFSRPLLASSSQAFSEGSRDSALWQRAKQKWRGEKPGLPALTAPSQGAHPTGSVPGYSLSLKPAAACRGLVEKDLREGSTGPAPLLQCVSSLGILS